jgi:hypothetical protein
MRGEGREARGEVKKTVFFSPLVSHLSPLILVLLFQQKSLCCPHK